jgi:hypothetical protein
MNERARRSSLITPFAKTVPPLHGRRARRCGVVRRRAATERRRGLERMNAQLAESAERTQAQQYRRQRARCSAQASPRATFVTLAATTDDEIGELRRGFNTVTNIAMVVQVHEIVPPPSRRAAHPRQHGDDGARRAAADRAGRAGRERGADDLRGRRQRATSASWRRWRSAPGRTRKRGGRAVRDTFSMDTIVSSVTARRTVAALGEQPPDHQITA